MIEDLRKPCGGEMQELVRENYRNHPKFSFEESPLTISDELVQSFSKSYGEARSPISENRFSEAEELIGNVFDELRGQTSDVMLLDFLDELEQEARQLMSADLPFRRRLKMETSSISELASELNAKNHFFGSISKEAVEEILAIGATSLSKFRENARRGQLKRSDLSIDSGPIVGKIAKVIDREFKRQDIFTEVSRFVGVEYRFTGLSLELSYEGSTWWKDAIGNERPPKTMYAHLDESVFAPKSIVYLSDVKSENGPTTLFPAAYQEMGNNPLQDIIGRVVGTVGNKDGTRLSELYRKSYHQSAGSPDFRRHFMMLPESLRFNSHLGWEVLPGSELEKSLAEREIEMLGPAGTFIVFDGSNLLHRGGLIQQGERVVLQVVFYPGTRWSHRLKLALRLLRNLVMKR